MATGDFDSNYGSNPWANLDKNERQWYDPDLVAMFRQKSVFANTIPFVKHLGEKRARTMTVSQIFDVHPDSSPLSMRQLWMPAAHIDSRAIDITFNRYGGKTAYHKYDDYVTYWQKNGKAGLRRIMRGALGQHMTDVMDNLARNAYIEGSLTSGYNLIEGGGDDFAAIGTADKFDPAIAEEIWLGMTYREVAAAQGVNGAAGSIVCYTSPGVIFDIQKDESWKSAREYADPKSLLRYEVGATDNVRYVQTPKCTLWNCGEILVRAKVVSAINAGDGSPDPQNTKVDGTYATGQDGMTHYIQLDAVANWDAGDFDALSVGQIVSIHASVTDANGITDGVNYKEGKLHNRRIVTIDADNDRIVLDRPVMVDFTTDLGGGTYAYLTLGRHVHASIFVASPFGIVSGVSQAPQIHTPPAVDDFASIHRFSWDGYFGHQLYAPEVFEVVFSAGTTRVKGAKVVQ
jgi:N4-gp56 family major capsid protein